MTHPRSCRGHRAAAPMSRREVLRAGGLGLFGLGWPELLAARAAAPTPRVGQSVVGGAGAGRDGRDHWPHVFTSVLAGEGVRGGVVHGASDRYAAYPAAHPTAPADLAATVYHCLGVDPHTQLRDRLGRPLTLCEGTPIQAVLR